MNLLLFILPLILLPLLSSILVVVFKNKAKIRDSVNIIISFISFIISIILLYHFSTHNFYIHNFHILQFSNNLFFGLQIDGTSIIFAILVNFLWPATIFYTISYLRDHNKHTKTRFFCFLNLSIMATMGIAFSGNLITTFAFYEALTLLTYPLVTHTGSSEAKKSGRIYLGILMGTSMILFLPAIILTYINTGTTTYTVHGLHFNASNITIFIIFIMFLFGVGKTALMPFHSWLPRAMVAPAPASALLHAVAVVKSGIFVILKIVIYIFGVDNLESTTSSIFGFNILLIIPVITIIVSSLINVFNTNLKKILAYSTISQLAYIMLCILLLSKTGIIAAILYLITHSLAKIVLFFVAGAVIIFTHKESITDLPGISKKLPYMMVMFALSALSIAGIPYTSGFVAKAYLSKAIIEDHQYLLFIVIIVSSILIITYMFRIIYYAFFKSEEATLLKIDNKQKASKALPIQLITMSLVITTIVSINIILFFVYPELVNFITPMIRL
ncbi:proton-conducting transporter membrane subunit [Rickettsiales bacterium LUAb2]